MTARVIEWRENADCGYTKLPQSTAFEAEIQGHKLKVCEMPMGSEPSRWIPWLNEKPLIGFTEFAHTDKQKSMDFCVDMALIEIENGGAA